MSYNKAGKIKSCSRLYSKHDQGDYSHSAIKYRRKAVEKTDQRTSKSEQ